MFSEQLEWRRGENFAYAQQSMIIDRVLPWTELSNLRNSRDHTTQSTLLVVSLASSVRGFSLLNP